jgi:hypothetical protein
VSSAVTLPPTGEEQSGYLLQRARPVGSSAWVEFRDARVLLFADGLVARVNAFVDIDEDRSAAERLAQERG